MDPTNSCVVWTSGYTKIAPSTFLKTAVPIGWAVGAAYVIICYFMLGIAL